MNKIIVVIALFTFLLSPAFADTTLTVNGTSRVATYINTGDNVTMLNLSLQANNGSVTVTSLLINLTTAYTTISENNISAFIVNVSVYNDTSGDGIFHPDVDTTLFGSNITFGNETRINATNIAFSGIVVGATDQVRLLVVFRLNLSASVSANLSANVSAAANIGANQTVNGNNFPIFSAFGETRDVHASVTLRPNVVDTNVTNQTIIYNFTITGATAVNKTRIRFPSGYTIVNVTSVTRNGVSRTLDVCFASADVCTIVGTTEVNLTFLNSGGLVKWDNISVTLTLNTSLSALPSHNINSSIYSVDYTMSNISTSFTGNSINLTTQPIINGTSILIAKGAAIVNGTDYWEFNITLNFSANVPGIIQIKMFNWTDGTNNISLTNSSETEFYATLRNETNFNTTGKVGILNRYNTTAGINHTASTASTFTVIMRMVVPSGTPISSGWFAIYNILFRSVA